MQLLTLAIDNTLGIGKEIEPITLTSLGVKEVNLEDLIVKHPGLLNRNDYLPGKDGDANADLLIIDRQPMTMTRKRGDLFGIDREGYLVIVEIKRDAKDEKNRREAMEFQAIRYAASSRKLTVDGILDRYAAYLRKMMGATEIDLKELALKHLCAHLSNEDHEYVGVADLAQVIQPREKQKIYLVASDFERDLLSGCAWLREHQIDIYCFRLRPYQIGTQVVLERERLIPPPELDDFMLEMAAVSVASTESIRATSSPAPSNKPTALVWLDDPDTSLDVKSWRDVIRLVIPRALDEGLGVDDLPMLHASGSAVEAEAELSASHQALAIHRIEERNLSVNIHGSAEAIRVWIEEIAVKIGKTKWLSVATKNGVPFEC